MGELKLLVSTVSTVSFTPQIPSQGNDPIAEPEYVPRERAIKSQQVPVVFDTDTAKVRSVCSSNPTPVSDIEYFRFLLGSVEIGRTRNTKHSANTSETRCLSLQFPAWICNRRYQLQARRSYNGWDYKLRAYYVTSENDTLFTLCHDGDVKGLQRLFEAGLASPFTTDYYGNTTLHVSIVISSSPEELG